MNTWYSDENVEIDYDLIEIFTYLQSIAEDESIKLSSL